MGTDLEIVMIAVMVLAGLYFMTKIMQIIFLVLSGERYYSVFAVILSGALWLAFF